MKDKLLLVCGSREGGAGGAAPWPPSSVFTSNELLNPDKNGLKLPPKAATTAAYCGKNALHYWVCICNMIFQNTEDGCIIRKWQA